MGGTNMDELDKCSGLWSDLDDYPQPWSYERYPGHRTFDITAANGAYVGRVEVEEIAKAICAQFGGGRAMSLAEQFPVAVPV